MQVLPPRFHHAARHRAGVVFFPAGNLTALEAEALYLMEALHQPYDAIMAMPVGRRKRFCDEHEHIGRMRKRENDNK